MKKTFTARAGVMLIVMGGSFGAVQAKPQWENKWHRVKDGAQNKIFVRFGQDQGYRVRQWGNGYDHKVRLSGRVIYQGAGPGQPDPDRTFESEDKIWLEPKEMSDEALNLRMDSEPIVDIVARLIG